MRPRQLVFVHLSTTALWLFVFVIGVTLFHVGALVWQADVTGSASSGRQIIAAMEVLLAWLMLLLLLPGMRTLVWWPLSILAALFVVLLTRRAGRARYLGLLFATVHLGVMILLLQKALITD